MIDKIQNDSKSTVRNQVKSAANYKKAGFPKFKKNWNQPTKSNKVYFANIEKKWKQQPSLIKFALWNIKWSIISRQFWKSFCHKSVKEVKSAANSDTI